MKSDHFVDQESYCGPGCTSEHGALEEVGNQPNISDADSTEEIRGQSIPHYAHNPCSMGSSYKNYK